MAERLLNGLPVSALQRFRLQGKSQTKLIRIRPLDGGLRTDVTAENIELKQSPRMQDTYFFKNELRKAYGSSQLGSTLAHPAVSTGLFKKLDGILVPFAITTKNLYRFQNGDWVIVAPGSSLSGTLGKQISATVFDGSLFFISLEYELRSWNGAAAHAEVSGGFAAKGMDFVNNRLVLVNVIENGVQLGQTIKWTQNGIVSFTGTGSGSRDLADRSDHIQNIRKLGPYRAFVYKEDSIVDMRATGDASFPFDTTEFIGGLGLLCAYSLTEWAGGHFFVGNDENIYSTNGNGLEKIGDAIRYEFFSQLNPSTLDLVTGFYDRVTREYIIIIPIGSASSTAPSLYYAYNTDNKRWRSGIYDKLTSFSRYLSSLGVSWDEDVGTWDQATDTWNDEIGTATRQSTIVSTSDGKIHQLKDTVFSFNGTPLSFSWESGDIVGPEDGDEVTLLEVIVGYIVDGNSSLTVDASNDGGNSFSQASTVALGGSLLIQGDIQYVHVPFVLTGDLIRVRLRNSNASEKIRLVSLAPRVNISSSTRSEATR